VSRCLLGDRVRYDGEIKRFTDLLGFIQANFQIIAVCPEVEIGLAVPRPAVQLSGDLNNLKLTGRDDASIDITHAMQHYCTLKPVQLDAIRGYLFKSKSPSCGIRDIPVFDSQGKRIALHKGMFAQAIMQQYPELPITDEQGLCSAAQREDFLQQVHRYRQTS
jgi:uncharacterized protein YbbK (DUF523 family)